MSDVPICEECDIEMHPFATETKHGWVEGWSCDGCGWSFDTTEGDPFGSGLVSTDDPLQPPSYDELRALALSLAEALNDASAYVYSQGLEEKISAALSSPVLARLREGR